MRVNGWLRSASQLKKVVFINYEFIVFISVYIVSTVADFINSLIKGIFYFALLLSLKDLFIVKVNVRRRVYTLFIDLMHIVMFLYGTKDSLMLNVSLSFKLVDL